MKPAGRLARRSAAEPKGADLVVRIARELGLAGFLSLAEVPHLV